MFTTIFHLIATMQFGFACYYDYVHVNVPGAPKFYDFGGKFKYLTYLNAVVITSYFALALVNDLIGETEQACMGSSGVRRLKDVMFCSLTFPLSMFVASTFWGIYAIDRELILPSILDKYFPFWLNHVMHTNIVIFCLLDLVLTFRMYPQRKTGLSILFSFMMVYLAWIHIIYIYTGRWVYPILKVLNWPMKGLFYLLSLGMVFGAYELGESLNYFVWHKQVDQAARARKKKVK